MSDHIPTLVETEAGLTLTDGRLSLTADFTSMLPRLRRGNLQSELLVKAARIKGLSRPIRIVDATAGLGEDSLLFAAAGFSVRLYESDPVIAALLRDALARAAADPQLSDPVSRMVLFEEDSTLALPQLAGTPDAPDVVYLDPMFPERHKSGLIKKKFQLLQQLERPCGDEGALMEAALAAKPQRIVIKRPLKGPYLAGVKPSWSLTGKAIRCDVLVLPENMGK